VLLGLSVIAAVLWTLISKGYSHVDLLLFTELTPGPNMAGGLLNAFVGSLIMPGLALLISAPIAVLIAIYLVESPSTHRLARYVRFFNDVLLSAPSIIVGLFIYIMVVRTMGHFSAMAGALSLAVIALPMIVRASEDVISLSAQPLREAVMALGAPRWAFVWLVLAHAARSGIITALLLAFARVLGETAPLLFTALNSSFLVTNLWQPMANLPVVIYQFAMSPYDNWQGLAWAGALMLTIVILVINLLARLIGMQKS